MRIFLFLKNNILFVLAVLLILIGTILQIIKVELAPYIFSTGAFILFLLRIIFPSLNRDDFRQKRLHKIQFISSVLLLLSAYFMFVGNNNWALSLFLAAIFDWIVILRTPKEE